MKTFITALVIFVLLLTVIITNCIYTSVFSKNLSSFIEELKTTPMSEAEETILKLEAFWLKNEFYIMLSNDHSKGREIQQSIQMIKAAVAGDDLALYNEALLSLESLCKSLVEFNGLSIEGVL